MRTTIDFYFDFLSPFAYLASYRLTQIAARHDCTIAWHAIDLAQIKLAAGNTGPGNRDMPVKLDYMKTDLARWADEYAVPFNWVGNYASRQMNIGALYARQRDVEEQYVRDAFHAGWGCGGTLDDPDLLRRLARMQGWDGDEFLRYVDSPAAAAAFAVENSEAITRRVFGVPTMLLGAQMWWGNDRLFMLDRALAARA